MANLYDLERIREEERKVRAAVKERIVGYILAALGLVAGLAWNSAFTAAIKEIFPNTGNGIIAQFIYAMVLTVVVAVIAYYMARFFADKADKKD